MAQADFNAVGRRKSAVARVRFVPGDGKIKINEDKTEYFGALVGNTLEMEVNGAKVVLEKAK